MGHVGRKQGLAAPSTPGGQALAARPPVHPRLAVEPRGAAPPPLPTSVAWYFDGLELLMLRMLMLQ